jgi:hypothetical protein
MSMRQSIGGGRTKYQTAKVPISEELMAQQQLNQRQELGDPNLLEQNPQDVD